MINNYFCENLGLMDSYLKDRCQGKCELCGQSQNIEAYIVSPRKGDTIDEQVALCDHCLSQVEKTENLDSNHLRCVSESIWSEVQAVQVVSYRLLNQLSEHGWAQDAKDAAYLDEITLEWAESLATKVVHKDSNGNILSDGDTVSLIQDLNVKGAGFTAKRGTAVRRIRLVHDNAEHIEGKAEGQHIVILTKYVKRV